MAAHRKIISSVTLEKLLNDPNVTCEGGVLFIGSSMSAMPFGGV
jgi:hypothetical protein